MQEEEVSTAQPPQLPRRIVTVSRSRTSHVVVKKWNLTVGNERGLFEKESRVSCETMNTHSNVRAVCVNQSDVDARAMDKTASCTEPMDSYTAGIELLNACRNYYVTKEKASKTLKQKLQNDASSAVTSSCDADDDVTTDDSVVSESNGKRTSNQLVSCSLQGKMKLLKDELVSCLFSILCKQLLQSDHLAATCSSDVCCW